MKMPDIKDLKPKAEKKSAISKEFAIGLLAVVIGGYNLLASLGVIGVFVEVPQIIGNILLVLAGLFLWITAYKVSRYKYHTSRIF